MISKSNNHKIKKKSIQGATMKIKKKSHNKHKKIIYTYIQ